MWPRENGLTLITWNFRRSFSQIKEKNKKETYSDYQHSIGRHAITLSPRNAW